MNKEDAMTRDEVVAQRKRALEAALQQSSSEELMCDYPHEPCQCKSMLLPPEFEASASLCMHLALVPSLQE